MSSYNPYEEWKHHDTNGVGNASRVGSAPGSGGPTRTGQATSAQDFEKLCRSIEESVSQMAKVVGKDLGRGLGQVGSAVGQTVSAYSQTYRQARSQAQAADPTAQDRQQLAILKSRFRSTTGLTVSGTVMASFGGVFTVSFVVGLIAVLLVFMPSVPAAIGGATLAIFAALSAWLLAAGVRRLTTSQRFKAVKRVFGNREVCNISELAVQLHLSKDKTLASIRRMLKFGLLPQGRLDDEGTCLIVTDDAYRSYRQLQQARQQQLLEQSRARQAAQAAEAAQVARTEADARAVSALPEQARTFVSQGGSYLQELRELDEAIDDAQVSAKIVAIENVVERLLARVCEEPSTVDGMGRLMDYYLPTTVKLLDAYDSLEDQPVQGDTIASSRREIEQTLDVLHAAFEKLLDESFQDLSLDVSSDISVLHAMLAQEGLAENPFDQRK